MRYHFEIDAKAIGYAKQTYSATYNVVFHSNGGTGTMNDQPIPYNVPTHLNLNAFTRTNYLFAEWNTSPDGTGTTYFDGEEINNTIESTIDLYAQWVQGTAEINGTEYTKIQDAINLVTKK